METEGCYDRTDLETVEPTLSSSNGGLRTCRSCSPAEQLQEGAAGTSEELQQPSDVATEVTIRATPEPTVSSLICSGLQTIHGAEHVAVEQAWEESYNLEPEHTVAGRSVENTDVAGHVHLHRDQVASQLDTYPIAVNAVAQMPVHSPYAQNTNNSNSCAITPSVDEGVRGVALTTIASEPPKKRSKIVKLNNAIEITLEGKNLWDEFCRRGTEMIVNRSGRRMFPGFSVAVAGLKPKVKYTMKLEVVLADNHRFKFLNARWLAVGTAEPQPLSESYIHPDSPNSGAFWMRHGISFRKLKITNNKERPGNNALLHSMHKYFLRLVVEEERKSSPREEKLPAKTVLQMDFPETTFIAVTAYQNEEVTQLKITNNPFAKAFRDNAADMDWDTAQMLYNQQQGYSPLFHPYPEHFSGNQMVAPGSWPLPSPLLPPTPLTASLPPISPLTSFTNNRGYLTPTAHYPYTSTSCGAAPVGPVGAAPLSTQGSTAPGYFQWPSAGRHAHHGHAHHHVITSSSPDVYDHFPSSGSSLFMCPSAPAPQPATNQAANNLPDFDTVFTSTLGPHTSHS